MFPFLNRRKIMKDTLDMSIQEILCLRIKYIGLSPRAYSPFYRTNIVYVSDLIRYSKEELLEKMGFGKKIVEEIDLKVKRLTPLGLHLGMTNEEIAELIVKNTPEDTSLIETQKRLDMIRSLADNSESEANKAEETVRETEEANSRIEGANKRKRQALIELESLLNEQNALIEESEDLDRKIEEIMGKLRKNY